MRKHRILIVEDEMIVQMHLVRIVSELGHEVTGVAASVVEAVQASELVPPDLVLMDIHLAGGGDGVEVARQICDRWDSTVVFLTAYADPTTIERTSSLGAAGYIVKPFTPDQVRAAVATALASRERNRKRTRSLASALSSVGDAIFVADETRRISFANPQAAELTGWGTGEACGRDLLEVVRPATREGERLLDEAVLKAQDGQPTTSLSDLEILTRQGEGFAVDCGIEPIHDDEEQGAGLIAMLRRRGRRPVSPRARTAPSAFGDGSRILLYSHDTLGLGHLRRCLILLKSLCARHPRLSALLVTGSPIAHQFRLPPGSDYVKLPAVRKTSARQYESRSLSLGESDMQALRSNLVLRTARDFDPDVILVDHSPIGCGGEILPTLEWSREHGRSTNILGMRDIIDDPRSVISAWTAGGIYGVLEDLYDHVAVYSSREFYDPIERYEFPARTAAKTRFVHHVADLEPSGSSVGAPAAPTVAVSIGGGDGGADIVLFPFLEMMRARQREIDFVAEILLGPLLSPGHEQRCRNLARGLPVTLRSFVASVAPLYRAAEIVVSTAGYNTVADQLAHSRRALLVPRVLYREEQAIRARRMEELGLAACLLPQDVTPDAMFEAIQRARTSPAEPLVRARELGFPPLDGASQLVRFCEALPIRSR